MMQRTRDAGLVPSAHDLSSRSLNAEENYQRFSGMLLKNKSLLVPTRLALKRQRATLKGLDWQTRSAPLDGLQMELGNSDEFFVDLDDEDEAEQERRPAQPRHTTPLSMVIPRTAPTDMSLLHKEKPAFPHPVAGNSVFQHAEGDGGPSPCSYVLPRRSCREKNAPAYTFGARCFVEKKGGSRTGWQKQWFAHSNPFTTKVDFGREPVWPSPSHYSQKANLAFQRTKMTFPSWSMGSRPSKNPVLTQENHPSPDTYDTISAFRKLRATNTPITLKSRTGGTQLYAKSINGLVPGPGAHDDTKFLSNKHSAPKHSFGMRIPTSLGQDPYVNTMPT